jgi:menaquinone-dependent protoporphyrinogen IX oxidase
MRRISAKNGGPTDTSVDHDYTDWPALRALAQAMGQRAQPARPLVRSAAG